MSAEFQFDVFLSHSAKDKVVVRPLAERLRQDGMKVWFDEWEIKFGDSIPAKIEEGLEHSRILILCMSVNAFGSDWAQLEAGTFRFRDPLNRERRFIPLRLDDAPIKGSLAQFLYIDWGRLDREQAYVKLADACRLSAPRERIGEMGLAVVVPDREILVGNEKYVLVPGGSFAMGSNDGYPHERPKHPVELSPYFLAVYPITTSIFSNFVAESHYVTDAENMRAGYCLRGRDWVSIQGSNFRNPRGPGSDVDAKAEHPVVQVSWNDAKAFCNWRSTKSRFHFDLPSEAQWERAAAGLEGHVWAYGNSYAKELANTDGSDTTRVGHYQPSAAGFYDMTGNVYEWCSDWYAASWLAANHDLEAGTTRNPQGPSRGRERVLRGGSWFDSASNSRCANRFKAEPFLSADNWGFRCQLQIDERLQMALQKTEKWNLTL